ncbi:MAG: transporter substrate-binding domain-containing protein [Pseudomonadota bacterium]
MIQLRSQCARALIAGLTCALFAVAPARADWQKIQQSGTLKVAVYNEFAPFSNAGAGIDIDLAGALAKKLGLRLTLLPFPAGEDLNDDLRNMVWKGHYLGYGPADLMLHVPVDNRLMATNPQVEIFAPYHVETLRLVRSAKSVPVFDGLDALVGKRIGVEKVSVSGMVMLGEDNGKFRDAVRIFPTAIEALERLKAGELDAVLANRSEIESVLRGDPGYPLHDIAFQRLPRSGWAVGMAVRKEDTAMGRLLQQALNELAASGELKAIFASHGVQVVTP